MKFYQETAVTGELVLIRTNTLTPPPCPVIAQSAKPAAPWLVSLFLLLISFFSIPLIIHWVHPAWEANKPRLIVLAIVAMAFVEVIAQNHIEKSLAL
jgi:uncharacterized membrane protein YadS